MARAKSTKKNAKMDFSSLAKRTRSASQGLSSQDEDLQKRAQEELPTSSAREMSLREIGARPSGDTRVINPLHALELALSIEAVGLIEPLVVDRDHHLLAGGHRLTALRILSTIGRAQTLEELRASDSLATSQRERFEELSQQLPKPTKLNMRKIPVRVFDFSAREDVERAIEVETSENTLRRDYTPKELLELYERLLSMGYEDVRGRPSSHQKPVKPALALIIGQSLRTVQRKLKAAQDSVERDDTARESAQLEDAIRRLNKRISQASAETRAHLRARPDLARSVKLLQDSLSALS